MLKKMMSSGSDLVAGVREDLSKVDVGGDIKKIKNLLFAPAEKTRQKPAPS